MKTHSKGISYLEVLGIAAIIVSVIVIFAPVFLRGGHPPPKRRLCLSNLKQLGTAFSMYESDWNDQLPPLSSASSHAPQGKTWMDKIMVYARNKHIAECPSTPGRLTYSFSRKLSGMREKDIKAKTADLAIVWDSVSDSDWNNNLNSDNVFWPAKGRTPEPGCYIVWTEKAESTHKSWPNWAQPNHEDVNNVLYVDGHVKPCNYAYSDLPLFSPK